LIQVQGVKTMSWTESGFGTNDYWLLGLIIITWCVFFRLPKIFSKQFTVLIFIYSLTIPSIMDNSIGVNPFNFYDIMDGPKYTGMDLVVYLLYPPNGYFFLYFYNKFCIDDKHIVLFITITTITSFCFEWINHKLGIFHYKNGYQIVYSPSFYLISQTLLVLYYRIVELKR
jgi:hypothetical protein